MIIRKLDKKEYKQAASLAMDIYMECGQEDFDEIGQETFRSFVSSEQLMDELTMYGAFMNEDLIGIMGTKQAGKHISLFFIRKEYHRQEIGRLLFDYAFNDCPVEEMSVNSSTYAVEFYQSLGFEKTDDKQVTNGITYTPMIRRSSIEKQQ